MYARASLPSGILALTNGRRASIDLLTALPLPPLPLLFLLAMCFLAGFVDAVAGGGGLISLPAFLACGLPSHVAFACNMCQSAISALIGLAIGAYDGLVGPGTGTFAIIAFNVALRYDLKGAGGNAKVMNLASNYASFAVMLAAGKIDFAIALPAAVFSVAGHTIGSGMALKRGARLIQPMLVAVLALLLVNLASQLL